MRPRKLSLKRETLAELSLTELDSVVGATATRQATCVDSLNVPCELFGTVQSADPAVFYCLTFAGPECIF